MSCGGSQPTLRRAPSPGLGKKSKKIFLLPLNQSHTRFRSSQIPPKPQNWSPVGLIGEGYKPRRSDVVEPNSNDFEYLVQVRQDAFLMAIEGRSATTTCAPFCRRAF